MVYALTVHYNKLSEPCNENKLHRFNFIITQFYIMHIIFCMKPVKFFNFVSTNKYIKNIVGILCYNHFTKKKKLNLAVINIKLINV